MTYVRILWEEGDYMSIFKSKVAVITGGANWIGRFIAEEFRKKGASICVIDKAEGNHFVGDISDKAMLETLSTNVPTRNFSMRCPSVWQHRFTCLFEIFISNRKTLINLIKKLIYLVDTILLCHHTNPNICSIRLWTPLFIFFEFVLHMLDEINLISFGF